MLACRLRRTELTPEQDRLARTSKLDNSVVLLVGDFEPAESSTPEVAPGYER